MFSQIERGEEEGESKERGEHHSDRGMLAYAVDGCVAGDTVDKGAVLVHARLELLECEIAVGAIGERAVAVQGVLVQVQRRSVKMNFIDDHVGRIGSRLIWNRCSNVKDSHDA